MFPFDVILFDVGGVLLTNGWDHCERALVLDRFGVDRADFETRHAAAYGAWERGLVSAHAYLDQTVFHQPRAFSREEFLDAICAQSMPLADGALGILTELAASKKCMLGLFNNEARETNEFRLRHFGLRALVQAALSSCYLGLRKPDAAMYHRALDILGRPPERVLFIDDRAENIAGAANTGMHTIRFEGAAALRRALQACEVL